jgi:hypothetical protein
MEIVKQITAKIKGFDIIDSCENANHWVAAERYIKLYFDKFNDLLGKQELDRHLQEHKLRLLNHKNG